MGKEKHLGLETGIVKLFDHEIFWEEKAYETIKFLKNLFGIIANDIQHIGSTSIKGIKAKPIIDILVGIDDLKSIDKIRDKLSENGLMYNPKFIYGDIVFTMGNMEKSIHTHYIHVVKFKSINWNNHINFRDFMNCNEEEAKNYEKIKIESMKNNEKNIKNYHMGKNKYIIEKVIAANDWKNEIDKRKI